LSQRTSAIGKTTGDPEHEASDLCTLQGGTVEKYSAQITPAIMKQTNDTIVKTRGTAK
jgi:hypothetical protein